MDSNGSLDAVEKFVSGSRVAGSIYIHEDNAFSSLAADEHAFVIVAKVGDLGSGGFVSVDFQVSKPVLDCFPILDQLALCGLRSGHRILKQLCPLGVRKFLGRIRFGVVLSKAASDV